MLRARGLEDNVKFKGAIFNRCIRLYAICPVKAIHIKEIIVKAITAARDKCEIFMESVEKLSVLI